MNFTKRQTQIVELLACEMTAEQAADKLSRAIPTVNHHIQLAYERADVRNTAHLAATSISSGFIKALFLALAVLKLAGTVDASSYCILMRPRVLVGASHLVSHQDSGSLYA